MDLSIISLQVKEDLYNFIKCLFITETIFLIKKKIKVILRYFLNDLKKLKKMILEMCIIF